MLIRIIASKLPAELKLWTNGLSAASGMEADESSVFLRSACISARIGVTSGCFPYRLARVNEGGGDKASWWVSVFCSLGNQSELLSCSSQ